MVYQRLDELVTIVRDGIPNDDLDIVISAMGIDDERTQRSIAVPYFKSGLTILTTRSDVTIADLDDLDEKKVAAVKGSTEFGIISRMRNVTIVTAYTYTECVNHLITGKADAAVLDVPVALLAAKRSPTMLRVIATAFEDEWYGIYMSKDEKQLFRDIRLAVQKMRRNGTFERLRAKWF